MKTVLRVLSLALAVACSPALAADLKVFSTVAFGEIWHDLKPKFEAHGHKVELVLAPSGALTKRVQDGETPDAIVTTSTGIDALAKSGKVDGASARALASSGVGLAVRKGAPRPDISTPEALRATLLAAKSVAYSDPAGGGASGIHFAKVLGQLGIAAQVNARAKLGRGIPNAEFLVKGESDIAVQQVPELMVVPGVDILGQLPGSLNNITVFSVAALRSSGNAAAARALVEFLAAPEALALMRAKGFSPAP